jgi:hypothetical protein
VLEVLTLGFLHYGFIKKFIPFRKWTNFKAFFSPATSAYTQLIVNPFQIGSIAFLTAKKRKTNLLKN